MADAPAPPTPPRTPEEIPPEFRVVTEITIISQLVGTLTARVLPEGLAWSQFGVLNHFVRRGGEETPAQLAAAFQISKGAMTNTLQRLEAQGFVAIRPDDHDGRRKRVSLTPAGERAHAEALDRLAPRLDALRAAFDTADFDAVLPFLSRLRAWFDENR